MIINRKTYLQNLDFYMETEQVKIITGPRRCGKSFLLDQIIQVIKNKGIKESNILKISMENVDFSDLTNYKKCHDYFKKQMTNQQKYYIFIDEVQEIDQWERLVNSLRLFNTCIFITGSNSKLLSGELATLLSGRYILFHLRNITFKEYFNSLKEFNPQADMMEAFNYYCTVGGYPGVLANNLSPENADIFINDIYESSLLRDVIQRHNIRDIRFLKTFASFMIDNNGRLTSSNKIANYLTSQKIKTSFKTINSYIEDLEEAFIIEKASRYDVRGKRILASVDKYYLADHSLMYLNHGYNRGYLSQVYENIVFNDLRARGYQVHIGKFNDYEIDFIAQNRGKKIYVQVSGIDNESSAINREIRPLKLIHDNYPKYVVTMNKVYHGNEQGIKFAYLPEFLLKEEL